MISLYNSFGKLMLKKKVDEKQLEIPVADYPAGVYMIRVETDVEMISKKDCCYALIIFAVFRKIRVIRVPLIERE